MAWGDNWVKFSSFNWEAKKDGEIGDGKKTDEDNGKKMAKMEMMDGDSGKRMAMMETTEWRQ